MARFKLIEIEALLLAAGEIMAGDDVEFFLGWSFHDDPEAKYTKAQRAEIRKAERLATALGTATDKIAVDERKIRDRNKRRSTPKQEA